jgi:hypothetical protein
VCAVFVDVQAVCRYIYRHSGTTSVLERASSLLHGVQLDPVVHPDFVSMNTRSDMSERKVAGV